MTLSKPAEHFVAVASAAQAAPAAAAPGVWVTYIWDHDPYVVTIHDTADAAALAASGRGASLARIPFGTEFSDAIKAWEAQTR